MRVHGTTNSEDSTTCHAGVTPPPFQSSQSRRAGRTNWELDAAWRHIAALVTSDKTDKSLLLAAIDAAANIRPHEAMEILGDLTDSDDEDVVGAAYEALAMAGGYSEEDDLDEDDEGEFVD